MVKRRVREKTRRESGEMRLPRNEERLNSVRQLHISVLSANFLDSGGNNLIILYLVLRSISLYYTILLESNKPCQMVHFAHQPV